MSNTVAAAKPVVSSVNAPWMRAAVLNMALTQGFTFEQVTTSVDRYTKGATIVEISWKDVVTGASLTKSGKLAKRLEVGTQGKLQVITTWLGHKTMTPKQKWAASDLVKIEEGTKVRATVSELTEQAKTAFRVIEG